MGVGCQHGQTPQPQARPLTPTGSNGPETAPAEPPVSAAPPQTAPSEALTPPPTTAPEVAAHRGGIVRGYQQAGRGVSAAGHLAVNNGPVGRTGGAGPSRDRARGVAIRCRSRDRAVDPAVITDDATGIALNGPGSADHRPVIPDHFPISVDDIAVLHDPAHRIGYTAVIPNHQQVGLCFER
jgi:hypothetical protein